MARRNEGAVATRLDAPGSAPGGVAKGKRKASDEAHHRAVEFAKISADAAYFTHNYGRIDDAQGHGEGGGTMPFHLWPAQIGVLWKFMLCRLVLILKARQLGISWLCCSYALWLCLFHPGKVVLLFSKGEREANELLRRVRVLYERLPDWLREASPDLEKSNTTCLAWSNESRVESHPATQSAGRGLTASLVILDECAFLQYATSLYTALKPVIDGGGHFIVLSTANGIGNLFHRLWTKAKKGQNTFEAIFLPWWSRPGRTRKWFADVLADSDDPALVPQEYPATANEAFVSTGRVRFHAKWIHRLAEWIERKNPQPLPVEALPDALQKIPGLTVWELPKLGARYVLGSDPAEGKEGDVAGRAGDYSAATLIEVCQRTGKRREVATLHGHIEPSLFGKWLVDLATPYRAEIVVERNNHGHAVLLAIQNTGYLKLVCGPDGYPGWLSNSVTKPLMIDALADALRDDAIEMRNAAALDEMQVYAILKNGSTGAPKSYHDDLVTSWGLCNIIARFPPMPEPEPEDVLDEDVEISAF